MKHLPIFLIVILLPASGYAQDDNYLSAAGINQIIMEIERTNRLIDYIERELKIEGDLFGDKKLKKAEYCELINPVFHRIHEDLKDVNKRLKIILEIQVERNK